MPEPVPRLRARTAAAGFVLHLAASAAFVSRRVPFDGLALLAKARRGAAHGDLMHLLYPWVLERAVAAGGAFGLAPETAGGLLSCVAASLTFTFLLLLLTREGAPLVGAVTGALLVSTSPDLWRISGSIEVYAPSLAALTGAGLAARAYRDRPRFGLLATAALAAVIAVGFHGCAALATPWIARLAGWPRRPPRAAHGLAAAGLALAAAAAVWTTMSRPSGFERYARYAGAFLPWRRTDAGALEILGDDTRRLAAFLTENVPLLAAAAAVAAGVLISRRRPPSAAAESLGLPFLAAFVICGVPVFGLLFPVLLALGLLVASGWQALGGRPRSRRAFAAVMGAALATQVFLAAPERWLDARRPDPLRAAALALAAELPPDAVVLAGENAWHFRHHAGLRVVALPGRLHAQIAASGGAPDPVAVVREVVRVETRAGRRVFITSDGLAHLLVHGATVADLEGLATAGPPRRVHADPPVWVVRLLP